MQVYNEVHDLIYHGNGGFTYSEVYNMPIHIRRYSIARINKHLEEVKVAQEKAQREAESRYR
jgi:hypothetical protein